MSTSERNEQDGEEAAVEASASEPRTRRQRTAHDAFFERAIEWLRTEARLQTAVLPVHRLDEKDGRARIEGYVMKEGSRAWAYGYAGLWALTIGIVLAMLGLPAVSQATRDLVQSIGYGGLVLGAVLLGLAALSHFWNRRRVIVELCSGSAASTTVVTKLHDDARGAAAWVVAERPLTGDAVDAAKRAGVRCLEARDRGFRDVARPEGAPASGARAEPSAAHVS